MDNPFKNYIIDKPKGSEKNSILKEIYEFYINDKQNRRKENWRRYCAWCRANKKPKGSEKEFKKTKLFIKELSPKVIAIKLSFIKDLNDLRFIRSICHDKFNRGENVGAYLLGSIKVK